MTSFFLSVRETCSGLTLRLHPNKDDSHRLDVIKNIQNTYVAWMAFADRSRPASVTDPFHHYRYLGPVALMYIQPTVISQNARLTAHIPPDYMRLQCLN